MAEVVFYGETFHVTQPSEFTFMEFAEIGERVSSSSTEGAAAIYRLLQESIDADPSDTASTVEQEWERFRLVARKNRATTEDLLPIVVTAVSEAAARPTERPSVSSDGPEPTPLRSVPQPVDPAMERLSGRPDLQSALLKSRRVASA